MNNKDVWEYPIRKPSLHMYQMNDDAMRKYVDYRLRTSPTEMMTLKRNDHRLRKKFNKEDYIHNKMHQHGTRRRYRRRKYKKITTVYTTHPGYIHKKY